MKLLNETIDFNDIEKIKQVLEDTRIEINDGKFLLDGKDVTKEIRTKKVNENVSYVSHIPEVREALVNLQRKMAKGKDAILEGRDIGTNVFPNANVKIYLDASIDERVKRRIKQNKEQNIDIPEEEVRKNIEERDYNDLHAKIAPLKKAEDAIYVDSSETGIDQTVKIISKIIKKEKHKYDMIEDSYNMWKETPLKIIARNVLKFIFVILYKIVFIPKNLYIWATMNTSDQNVFTLDNAFQRRWDMQLVKNECSDENQMEATITVNKQTITWGDFQQTINFVIGEKSNEGGLSSMEDKRLGCWFVKAEDKKIKPEVFANKVLKYLWDDAFKFYHQEIFGDIKNFEELQKAFFEKGFDVFSDACRLKEKIKSADSKENTELPETE